jgi:uncharacterized protein YjbI with pentapeptide repeats
MIQITAEKLSEIRRLHALYLNGDPEGQRADLHDTDLRDLDLSDARLRDADLAGACLSGGRLRGIGLHRACLRDASLTHTHLREADLRGADLRHACLCDADLRDANLCEADLRGAFLGGAIMKDTILSGALLRNDLKVHAFRFLSGLYTYDQWVVVSDKGVPWIRMGCLFHPLEKWDQIGIRESNREDFPDDGSVASEERVRAFEFARGMALVMVEEWRRAQADAANPDSEVARPGPVWTPLSPQEAHEAIEEACTKLMTTRDYDQFPASVVISCGSVIVATSDLTSNPKPDSVPGVVDAPAAPPAPEPSDEPTHPTYGRLSDLLAEVESDIRRGWLPRLGHSGALAWFSGEFGRLRSETGLTDVDPQPLKEASS